jgi:MFS family permease
MTRSPDDARRRRWPVILVLGITQVFAWGGTFYLPAVLAQPIAKDMGWPPTWIIGGLSIGLLVAGLASPFVGSRIQRHGGRPVLACACLLLALGQAILGLAQSLPVFLTGWLILGLGMGAGLYDPAFATLGRLYGANARPAISSVTLLGGFSSTVCWPLSAYLVEHFGWRATCFAYGCIELLLCLPLILLLVPNERGAPAPAAASAARLASLTPKERSAFLLLAGAFMIGSTILAMMSVHILALLQARGVALAAAVSLGALIGPAQVAARLFEVANGGRHHPIWTITGAVALVALGLIMLALDLPMAALALILYGAGNGIFSIARGTLPLTLFGPERYAALLGRLARPSLIASALAPSFGAAIVAHAGGDMVLRLLAGLAVVNVVLVALLWMSLRARPMTRPS